MIKVNYTELDGPAGPTCRWKLRATRLCPRRAGHRVCGGQHPDADPLRPAGGRGRHQERRVGRAGRPSSGRDGGSTPEAWVEGAFEFAKAGFALLAERYPGNVRFADLSGRGEQSMVDLQLFASEGGDAAAPSAPALSHAQAQQAIASGTMKADEAGKLRMCRHRRQCRSRKSVLRRPNALRRCRSRSFRA